MNNLIQNPIYIDIYTLHLSFTPECYSAVRAVEHHHHHHLQVHLYWDELIIRDHHITASLSPEQQRFFFFLLYFFFYILYNDSLLLLGRASHPSEWEAVISSHGDTWECRRRAEERWRRGGGG